MSTTTSTRPDFKMLASQLGELEWQMFIDIEEALKRSNPGRDRDKCDSIFGIHYITAYLEPCISNGLASRVAGIGGPALIKRVLDLEKELSTEFHKGVLFHDTAIACWLSGDEDGYEYLIAMTDEEEYKTTHGAHARATFNLRSNTLTAKTILDRMQFACDLSNGKIANNAANLAFMTGVEPIAVTQFDVWRQTLDTLHQYELLRILHDAHAFVGIKYPDYTAANDNPFVMLRLAKTLSHLSQWVESCLTHWQVSSAKTLGEKLKHDPDFGPRLIACAGKNVFPGANVHGVGVEIELRKLLADLAGAPRGDQREWRLFRILYIVRNSTAHTIEPSLAVYQDRALLLNLVQVVFVSIFSISQLKAKPMP
jgi:hypothetical protein